MGAVGNAAPPTGAEGQNALSAPPRPITRSLLGLLCAITLIGAPVQASLCDSYDGNIYALYAGNGSLVPPATTLADSQAAGHKRPGVLSR